MKHPLISIIVPTYNRKQMLFQCVDSILAQTYRPIEIIVVDDCSSDGTREAFAEKYGNVSEVTIFCNEQNMGCSYNRRLGYKKSKGELIVFMDDDDYYINNTFFEKVVSIYKSHKSVSLIGASSEIRRELDGNISLHKMDGKGLIKTSEYLKNLQLKTAKPDAFATVFVRDKIDQSGFLEMKMINDAPLCMRALLVGDAYLLEDIIGVYRFHGKNISYDLSIDFLMQNLDEKKYISDKVAEKSLFEDEKQWLYDQTMMTAQYFINGRGRTRQDISALCAWCRDNLSELGDKACSEIKKRYSKRKLRNVLKRIKSIFAK